MNILTLLSLLAFLIAGFIGSLAILTGNNSFNDREKLTPFECGFDPLNNARIPFSLRFFLITIIFLIFDVEVALLLPLGVISSITSSVCIAITSLLLTLILIAGLIHEWNQGALDWAA